MYTDGVTRAAALVLVTATALLSYGGCGGAGACVGVGQEADLDSCFQNENTEASCNGFNAQNLNGDTWTWYGGETCPDQGFLYQCMSGTYKLSSDYCE